MSEKKTGAEVTPTAAPVPTKVEVRSLRWPKSLYSKQYSEQQADTMGGYIRDAKLIHTVAEGGTNGEVLFQKDGKIIPGVIPTYQRQFIKLLLATFFTAGTSKGGGFCDAIGLNMRSNLDWVGKLAEGGWAIEAHYGSPTTVKVQPLFASIKDLVTAAQYLVNVRNSTLARFPVAEDAKPESPDATYEEVSLVL